MRFSKMLAWGESTRLELPLSLVMQQSFYDGHSILGIILSAHRFSILYNRQDSDAGLCS